MDYPDQVSPITDDSIAMKSAAWAKILLAGVLAALFAYLWWLYNSQPTIFGIDPYIRVFHQGDTVVNLQGRNWLPLGQWLTNASAAWGELPAIKMINIGVGLMMLLLFSLFIFRKAGPLAACIWPILLAADPHIMLIIASPFQEGLFYLITAAVFLTLSSSRPLVHPATMIPICLLLYLACLTRYEGVLLSCAVFVSLSLKVLTTPGTRKARWLPILVVLLLLIPFAWWAYYSGGNDEEHSTLSRGLSMATLNKTSRAMYGHVSQAWYLPWLLIAGLGIIWPRARKNLLFDKDLLSFHGYIALYLMLFLIVAPFQPVETVRGHIPVVIYATFLISWSIGSITRTLDTDGWDLAKYLATIGLVCICSAPTYWMTYHTYQAESAYDRPAHDAMQMVNALANPNKKVHFAWSRGDYHGHPEHHNMILAAYLDGHPSRVTFYEDYPEVKDFPADDFDAVVQFKETQDQHPTDLRASLEAQGLLVKETALPGDKLLLTW